MRIIENIAALRVHTQLTRTNNNIERTTLRLSSGFRINNAGDDPAGFAISLHLQNQIRGMRMADRNTMDGSSLLETADAALQDIHNILNRVRELAVQAANDTNTYDDRRNIQMEIDALMDEINAITRKVEFNNIRLLNGETQNLRVQVGGRRGMSIAVNIPPFRTWDMGLENYPRPQSPILTDALDALGEYGFDGDNFVVTALAPGFQLAEGIELEDINNAFNAALAAAAADIDLANLTVADFEALFNIENPDGEYLAALTAAVAALQNAGLDGLVEVSRTYWTDWVHDWNAMHPEGTHFINTDGRIDPHLPDDHHLARDFNWATDGRRLNVHNVGLAGLAIMALDRAISDVSMNRAHIGAYINRLEFTSASLQVAAEATSRSLSVIRDADMAWEMMQLSKFNIMNQAGMAIMAQVNAKPQQILQLLG